MVGKNPGFDLRKGNASGLVFAGMLEALLMEFDTVDTVCINRNGQKVNRLYSTEIICILPINKRV